MIFLLTDDFLLTILNMITHGELPFSAELQLVPLLGLPLNTTAFIEHFLLLLVLFC